MEDNQVLWREVNTGDSPLNSLTGLLGWALVYCRMPNFNILPVSIPLNDLPTTAGARGIHFLAAILGPGSHILHNIVVSKS